MSVQEIKSQLTGDKYYKVKHKSGLNIYVYEKEGYNSTYAVFGTTQLSAQMVERK